MINKLLQFDDLECGSCFGFLKTIKCIFYVYLIHGKTSFYTILFAY